MLNVGFMMTAIHSRLQPRRHQCVGEARGKCCHSARHEYADYLMNLMNLMTYDLMNNAGYTERRGFRMC